MTPWSWRAAGIAWSVPVARRPGRMSFLGAAAPARRPPLGVDATRRLVRRYEAQRSVGSNGSFAEEAARRPIHATRVDGTVPMRRRFPLSWDRGCLRLRFRPNAARRAGIQGPRRLPMPAYRVEILKSLSPPFTRFVGIVIRGSETGRRNRNLCRSIRERDWSATALLTSPARSMRSRQLASLGGLAGVAESDRSQRKARDRRPSAFRVRSGMSGPPNADGAGTHVVSTCRRCDPTR